MTITAPQAELISGGVQAGTSFISGILDYYATKETNAQNYKIYQQERKDKLASDKIAVAFANRQQNFTEQQTALSHHDALEQKGYSRLQSAYQRGADLLTQQLNLNQVAASPFQKYAGGK